MTTTLPPPTPLYHVYDTHNKKDPLENYGDQKVFKKYTNRTVSDAAKHVAEKDLLQMLSLLGEKRSQLAKKMHSKDREYFGKDRTLTVQGNDDLNLVTPLIDKRYREFNEKVRQHFWSILPRLQNERTFTIEKKHTRVIYTRISGREVYEKVIVQNTFQREFYIGLSTICHYVNEHRVDREMAPVLSALGNNKISFMSQSVEIKDRNSWIMATRQVVWLKDGFSYQSQEFFKDYGFGTILHCPRNNIDLILKPAQKIYNQLKDMSAEEKGFSRKLAKLEFYLFHATPFWRGSHAISENLLTALCQSKKVQWNPISDLVVLTGNDMDEYIKERRKNIIIRPK